MKTQDEIMLDRFGIWYHDLTADQLAAIGDCMTEYAVQFEKTETV